MSEASHTTGIKHEEHYGLSGKYHAGHEIAYFGGNEAKVFVGIETKLNVASGLGISLGTETHFGFGPEFKFHLGGASLGVSHASRPTYEDAFCATAGSDDLTYFHRIALYAKIMCIGQTVLFAAEAPVKVWAIPKSSEGDSIRSDWTAGAAVIQSILGNLVGLIATIFTFKNNWIYNKATVVPKSVVSINNASRAFIGVRSSFVVPLLTAGSSGLELNSNGFALTYSDKYRDFEKTGDEYTGFTKKETHLVGGSDIPAAGIFASKIGTERQIKIKADQFILYCADDKTQINLTGKGKSSLTVNHGAANQADLQVTEKESGFGFGVGNTESFSYLRPKEYQLKIGQTFVIDAKETECTIKAASGGTATVDATSAAIGFGQNTIKADSTGVNISGGALRILNPTVQAPFINDIAAITADVLRRATHTQLNDLKRELGAKQNSALARVYHSIDKVKRTTAAMIDKAKLAV